MNDPRLDANPIPFDGQDGAEMAAQINDEAGAEGFASQPATGSPRYQRHAILHGVADQGLDLRFIPGSDDAQRLDLKDTGVGTVERARQVIKEAFAPDEAPEIVAN